MMLENNDSSTGLFLGPTLGADDRSEPRASFEIPGSDKTTLAFYPPKVVFWIHLMQVMFLNTVFAAALARVVYSLIVKRRGSALSHLTGLAVIGIIISYPYAAVATLNVQNLVAKFTLCCGPALYLFRTSEAIFGFSPAGVERSFLSYLVYYSLPIELRLDRKTARPVETTREEMVLNMKMLGVTLLQLCAMISLLAPTSFEPFDGRPDPGSSSSSSSLLSYLNLGHLGNCFIAAFMFQQFLALYGFAMTALIGVSTGLKTIVSMNNPLLEATSPSDFWGRRWNVLVHGVLKRGVYKPVRRYGGSSSMASLAAFAASGLFHEWIIHVMSYRRRECSISCYEPKFGSNMAFFAWNALIIVVETILRSSGAFQKVGRNNVPRLAVTFLVVMTSLPVSHWFADPYIRQGLFNHYQQGFPLFAVIGK